MSQRWGAFIRCEVIMPDTRNALFVLEVGAGFFLAIYQ